ncbi:hypothetical protein Q427_04365 [Halomonas sp. BC04]|nr:hypothetical protein Q427_04365 [Halomonas sp. BC04]
MSLTDRFIGVKTLPEMFLIETGHAKVPSVEKMLI